MTPVAGDITTPEGRAAALAACPAPDILVNNAGGPPPGDFREWDEDDWLQACNANMITAIMLIKAMVDGMIARRFGRIVNITSSSVKAPIPQLGLSNGARSGLTGFVAGLARQTAEHNVTINNILPGPLRHRPAALGPGVPGPEVGPAGRRDRGRVAAPRSRPGGSARPRSSASSAPSSAAPRRATSPARTS